MTNSVDPDKSGLHNPTVSIFLYNFIRCEDFVLFAHVLNSTRDTQTHMQLLRVRIICVQLYAYVTHLLRTRICDISILTKL